MRPSSYYQLRAEALIEQVDANPHPTSEGLGFRFVDESEPLGGVEPLGGGGWCAFGVFWPILGDQRPEGCTQPGSTLESQRRPPH